MGREKDKLQVKEQEDFPEEELNEREIRNLSDIESE